MCRIAAITATDIEDRPKRVLMDILMLGGWGERQQDGWGVSDGKEIIKSGLEYADGNPDELRKLNPSKIWIGHVRSASYGTSISFREAHPYKMGHFIGMHNGGFDGAYEIMPEVGRKAPDSDTYRAFKWLDYTLDWMETGITAKAINHWAGMWYSNTTFVLGFLENEGQRLSMVRHDYQRLLHVAEVGNGYVFATTERQLHMARSRMRSYGIEVGITKFVLPKVLIQMNAGEKFDNVEGLSYNLTATPQFVLDKRKKKFEEAAAKRIVTTTTGAA